MAVFMLETLKLSKTLKSSRDDFNVLDNFNVSSIKTANFDDFTLFFCRGRPRNVQSFKMHVVSYYSAH